MTERLLYPLPELIDRYTITLLKIEHFPEEKESLKKEAEIYKDAINAFTWDDIALNNCIVRMLVINRQIWNLEAKIRSGDLKNITLEEVGKAAIEIRKVNGQRVKLKGDIADKTGSGFRDIKINHASEV